MSQSLDRFVAAQEPVMAAVMAELRAGRKRTHWMWFVFPQLRGLGMSAMAHRYGIADLAEARAYLFHAVLGPRLIECTNLAVAAAGSAREVFGSPDDMKFRSCATLFAGAGGGPAFEAALRRFYGGAEDEATLRLLA